MRTILDSSVLIDVLRRRPAAAAFLVEAAQRGELWSVTPVRTELIGGLFPGEEEPMSALLAAIGWQDVTVSIADRAGGFGRQFRRSHRIEVVDLLVAAAAVELGGDVATLNVRDFPMFPGLRPPY